MERGHTRPARTLAYRIAPPPARTRARMSRREQDHNNTRKAAIREQRIERLLNDLQLLSDEWDGKPEPLDVAARRARIEDEIRDLEAQRQQVAAIMDAPTVAQKVEYLNDAVMSLYPEITSLARMWKDARADDLKGRIARDRWVNRWLFILALLVAVAYGILAAVGVQVFTGG